MTIFSIGPKPYSLHRTDYARAVAAAVAPSRKDTNSSGAVPAAPAVPACVASSPEKQIWRAHRDIHTDYYFARNNSFCKTCDCPYFEYMLHVTGEDLESDQEFRLSEFSTIRAFSVWFIVLWEWQMCVNHTLLF